MKKKDSVSEFTSERNAALIANFRRNLAAQSKLSIDSAVKGATSAPARRFWVSEQRAAAVIARMLRADGLLPPVSSINPSSLYKECDPPSREIKISRAAANSEEILNSMFEEKREMYREIYFRVKEMLRSHPDSPICDVVFEVVNQPAPRSYMSLQRARDIIFLERRRRRRERSLI